MNTPQRSRTASLVGLGLAFVLVAAGCGSKSGAAESQVATLGTSPGVSVETTTTVARSTEEALLAVAQCLRDNGVDVPDPTFDANGNPTGGLFGPDSGVDPRSEEFRTAMEACRSLMQGVTLGGRGPGFDRQAIQDAMNNFTACLRDQGLEVDDVTFPDRGAGGGPNGGGTGGTNSSVPADGNGPPDSGGFRPRGDGNGPPDGQGFDPTARIIERLGLDATDPAVTAAVTSCQSILQSAFNRNASTTTTAG